MISTSTLTRAGELDSGRDYVIAGYDRDRRLLTIDTGDGHARLMLSNLQKYALLKHAALHCADYEENLIGHILKVVHNGRYVEMKFFKP